jgi:hypothetical protein
MNAYGASPIRRRRTKGEVEQLERQILDVALHERCSWHRCRAPFQRQRSTRRFCSGRCRVANYRGGRSAGRLRACRVELVSRREARALILRHELLGTCGNAVLWFGLRDPAGRLLSLVGFGHGANNGGVGADTVLERGYTRRRAPHNAASYLISRALKHGARRLGWKVVKAYSDPRFGEAGLVYKAAGFERCPPSKHGPTRYALHDGSRLLSDRAIYRRYRSHAAARAAGATIVRVPERVAWQWVAPP